MLTRSRRGWELPESAATPEALVWDRRQVLRSMGLAGAAAGLGAIGGGAASARQTGPEVAYPFPRNETFTLDRPMTAEKEATTYNNFYEFGSHKQISRAAQRLTVTPWPVKIDGLVAKEMTLDADDLKKRLPREQRLYRFRCVEAWAMALPWDGYRFADLVALAAPKPEARYVRMETFLRPSEASGQRQIWYPWPYVEGISLAEATNELTFMATGAYGKPLPPQMGAPLRLVLPWKYGFKSIKSIARITFTAERPKSFWETLQASEYGFWANVNPEVAHPRWSQASERMLGSDERLPTKLYNGYGAFVADLYKDLRGERLYA
jgi:sulfoxide reductase catalytic subunit YedY